MIVPTGEAEAETSFVHLRGGFATLEEHHTNDTIHCFSGQPSISHALGVYHDSPDARCSERTWALFQRYHLRHCSSVVGPPSDCDRLLITFKDLPRGGRLGPTADVYTSRADAQASREERPLQLNPAFNRWLLELYAANNVMRRGRILIGPHSACCLSCVPGLLREDSSAAADICRCGTCQPRHR